MSNENKLIHLEAKIKVFINNIKSKIKFNSKLKFHISIIENLEKDRCIAIVENNVYPRQCSKKCKHGKFCGLHYKRKNTFKIKEQRILCQKHFSFAILNVLKSQEEIIDDEYQENDEIDKYIKLYHNHSFYYLDYDTNDLYILNFDDKYQIIGKIQDFPYNFIII